MTLKAYVIEKVNPDDYYAARFKDWHPRIRGNVSCCFHSDGSRPNLAIGLKNGGARCHSTTCAKRIGNIVHFEAERLGIKESLAARRLYREFIRPVVSAKMLNQFRENLAENSSYILKIKKEMGLTYRSIRRFQLGLDTKSNRITIPVYDQFKQCINVRFYRLPSERTDKDEAKLYNLKGYGGADLFPWTEASSYLLSGPVFVMGSEKEAMLAIQDGYNAISSTAGEDKWEPEWDSVVRNREVCLVLDVDAGGDAARKRVEPLVAVCAKSVYSLKLPFRHKRKDRKDYADWRLREKRGSAELLKLYRNARPKQKGRRIVDPIDSVPDVRGDVHSDNTRGDIKFPELPEFGSEELMDIVSISSESSLLNKRIRTQGIVAAKSPNTYSIPWKFEITSKNKVIEYEVPMGRELLRFIRASDTSILQLLQTLLGSTTITVKPIEYLTATEVELIPTAVIDKDIPYVVQRCYFFGKRIEANVPYYLEIIPTSEIRSQETIGIITHISPLSKSIDRFDFTPENLADLSFFQPSEGEDVWDKLAGVADEVAHRYTRVYNRLDWTISALLTWCSPIGFRFPDDGDLQRGWLNTLAIGDTETGKSKVSKALKKLFNCGVFVSGENCTFVGLVGGAVKVGSGQLMLRWGRIPLSDKQLVILEELSGLSVEEISNMSDVRSSGFARLDKGGINAETNARTRLLCLSNSRSKTKALSQYLFGVHAVSELIGHGEDIARFDIITTLTDREVSTDIINSKDFAMAANSQMIAADQFQKLAHFIWALTPEQIDITQEAYEACLEETKRLSTIYHPSVPIFKGGSGRYKLGRIATAIACLQFAWNGTHIEVSAEHVEAAARLLQFIYDKPSLGYRQYSEQLYDREKVKDTVLVRKEFKERIPRKTLPKVLEVLIHATSFTRDEFCAVAGLNFMHADQLLGVMMRERALRHGEKNVWEITPAGKTFLEDFMRRLQK